MKSAHEKTLIPSKMQAEVALCANFASYCGAFLAAWMVVNGVCFFNHQPFLSKLPAGVCLVALMVALLAVHFRQMYSFRRHFAHLISSVPVDFIQEPPSDKAKGQTVGG